MLDQIVRAYASRHGLSVLYPYESRPDQGVLSDPATGRWYAVFMPVSGEEIGREEDVCQIMEAPFEPEMIRLLGTYAYCHEAVFMDRNTWLMFIMDENTDIQTYLSLLELSCTSVQNSSGHDQKDFSEEKEYGDVPLTFRKREKKEDTVPAQIEEVRRMYRQSQAAGLYSRNELFWRQACLLKDYTDDYVYQGRPWVNEISYNALTDRQLRGYFTWRTAVREDGCFPEKTPDCFIELYICELICCIHNSPEDTLPQLLMIRDLCMQEQRSCNYKAERLVNDFVMYYDLPVQYNERLLAGTQADDTLHRFIAFLEGKEEADLPFLTRVFHNRTERSVFLREHTEDFVHIFAKTVQKAQQTCPDILHQSLISESSWQYSVFTGALFYHEEPHADQRYWLSGHDCYQCIDDLWYFTVCSLNLNSSLIHETDRRMRIVYKYRKALRQKELDPALAQAVNEAILEYRHEQKLAARPKVEIDMSILGGIRDDAALTRESLLTEEDLLEEEEENEKEMLAREHTDTESIFTEEEKALICCLLEDRPLSTEPLLKNSSAALLADSINEKMMDELGDTVIEFDGDTPVLIDDYIDDLTEAVYDK